MLTLLKLPSAWGMRNASPFNLKAEALLAMPGLLHETREAMPSKGPMGKLPALIDGDRVIGDSAHPAPPGGGPRRPLRRGALGPRPRRCRGLPAAGRGSKARCSD